MSRSSRPLPLLWGNPFGAWMSLASRSAATLVASGEVIARRTQRMAASGSAPSGADRREMRLMVDEKVSAVGESAQAMGMQAISLMQSSAAQWMAMAQAQTLAMMGLGRMPSSASNASNMNAAVRASVAMAEAGLKPYHRRATANARRLRKRP